MHWERRIKLLQPIPYKPYPLSATFLPLLDTPGILLGLFLVADLSDQAGKLPPFACSCCAMSLGYKVFHRLCNNHIVE